MKQNIFIQPQFIRLLIIVSEEENVRFGNSTTPHRKWTPTYGELRERFVKIRI